MKITKLVQNRREAGQFALLLESKAATQRDAKREATRRQREQELRNDPANAAFLAVGIDPAEIFA